MMATTKGKPTGGFTTEQLASLAGKLDPDHIKTRQQQGTRLSYIEGWRAIDEANAIFGFDAWCRETIGMHLLSEGSYKKRNGGEGYQASYYAKVRVTVTAGDLVVVRDGTGYGSGYGQTTSPGDAHESAIKEAETDAMKRALMTFGNKFASLVWSGQFRSAGSVTVRISNFEPRLQIHIRPQLGRVRLGAGLSVFSRAGHHLTYVFVHRLEIVFAGYLVLQDSRRCHIDRVAFLPDLLNLVPRPVFGRIGH